MNPDLLAGVLATLAVLLTVAWLLKPWWGGQGEEVRRRQANVAGYRQRLGEIESEASAGMVSADDAAALREEAALRLLRDADEAAPPSALPQRSARFGVAIVLALLPVAIAGVGYYWQGSWRDQALIDLSRTDPKAAQAQAAESAVDQLVAHLEKHPDDRDAWTMLGRALFSLGRYTEAAQAYQQLSGLLQDQDPDVLVNQGEALALASDHDLRGRPRELFEQALQIAPANVKALWYAGLAAAQAGDEAAMRRHWTLLSQQEIPEQIRQILVQRLGPAGNEDNPVAGGEAAPSAAAEPNKAAGPPVQLRMAVTVSQDLLAAIPANATLFVFARAAQGPPMPLAVYRGMASELPKEIILDDSSGVMPTMKLSQFDAWTVTARISVSGQAQAQSGDLQGSAPVSRAQAGAPISLTIDQRVP